MMIQARKRRTEESNILSSSSFYFVSVAWFYFVNSGSAVVLTLFAPLLLMLASVTELSHAVVLNPIMLNFKL